jgi:hypothetical protein
MRMWKAMVCTVAAALACEGTASAQSCSGASDPVATATQFGAGSLVIPMDACYNPDTGTQSGGLDTAGSCGANAARACYNNYGGGNVRLPFGVIYLLAENNIPVSIILNSQKLGLGDADFSVTPMAGATTATVTHLVPGAGGYTLDAPGITCGTNTVAYSGMPFVVDASYAQQALQVLTAFDNANANLFTPVTLHVINYPFNAPVLATLESRPKPVVIDTSPLDTFFSESGIPAVAAANSTFVWLTGTSPSYSFSWPATLPPNPGCTGAGGLCSGLTWTPSGSTTQQRIVDVLWDALGQPVSNWGAVNPFFQNGGVVLAVDDMISWQSGASGGLGGSPVVDTHGAQSSPYCVAMASTNANPYAVPGPASFYPASDRFFQIDLYQMDVHGNGGGADGASSWALGGAPAANSVGLSDGTGYESIGGHPIVAGLQTPGYIVYLASLNSWHGNAVNKDGGLHIMYDTLLAGGEGCHAPFVGTELTRSDAVANTLTTSTGSSLLAEYQGTFDWKIPYDSTAGGNILYQPDVTKYPYTTGHFREYKQPGTYTDNADATCSATDPHSDCDWDAATLMKPVAQRRIYVVTGSAGAYQLTSLASITNSATLSYVQTQLNSTNALGNSVGVLGGIDYATAAVIEAVPNGSVTVAGAKTRPMLAYVGARDGMIHAFCVQPPTGQSKCYGLAAPGEELWAIITPGAFNRMKDAYNGGTAMDWSRLNMGGAARVADIKDTFEGSSGYRTVLIVGAHDSGLVDAIDISNPDPGQLSGGTSTGFSFLWENDGTNVDTSYVQTATTQTWMGPTNGATIAPMGQGAAVAMVTSASCNGNPTLRNQSGTPPTCAGSVAAGINTYLLRISDGAVIGFDQRSYARTTSLFNTPIPNSVPALPTTLDSDGDGIYESAYVASFEGTVRKYTLKAVASPPTVGSLDANHPAFVIFDASAGCAGNVACQPIGASPTLLANTTGGPAIAVLVATGGSDWARATTDHGDLTATQNLSHVYGFDAQAPATTTAYFARSFGGVSTPASAAAGSAPGVVPVPLSLRAYASLTVSGTDLYADVTSVGINTMAQLVQLVEPAITPGTWGATLRWSNVSTGTGVSALATNLTSGNGFAGGASSIIAAAPNGNAVSFVASVSGVVSGMTEPATTAPNSALSVSNKGVASGSRPFNVLTWFDL